MAVRRMNELWKSMPLALMFGLLLLHGCQGQDDESVSTSSQSVGTEPVSTNAADVPATEPTTASNTAPQSNGPDSSTATTTQGSVEKTTMSSGTGQQENVSLTQEPNNNSTANSKDESGLISSLDQSETFISAADSRSLDATPEGEKDVTSAGSSSAVFVSVLLTGLLLAGIIVGIYYFKCHRRTNGKGMKLAEESYMADEENQGNTLVSVAPLNQPEPQEKPSLNGESQEAVKPQTPPAATNGHSTTKTADTEL